MSDIIKRMLFLFYVLSGIFGEIWRNISREVLRKMSKNTLVFKAAAEAAHPGFLRRYGVQGGRSLCKVNISAKMSKAQAGIFSGFKTGRSGAKSVCPPKALCNYFLPAAGEFLRNSLKFFLDIFGKYDILTK